MKKRILETGLCALLLTVTVGAVCWASERRETPAVRAVKRAKTSVVNIHSEKTTFDGDSLFSSAKGRKVNGMGTGIVIDERGYIVTNHHVVAGVDSLSVTLYDGSTYDAQVVSYDRSQDLAIIKIDTSKPLVVMPLGTSSDLMLAETVMAVGNAFGYEDSVTAGIVSSLSRDVEVNEKQSYKNLIQTDASINPGNSGGPLINLDGEVVGINVAIRAGAQRIGFAIPIDDARKTIAKLLSIEELSNTWHGLKSNDVKKGEQRMLVVDSARPESPADHAGLQNGDIVLRADATDIVDGADFERALLGRKPGDDISITVERAGATETLKLTLAVNPKAPVIRANNDELRASHDEPAAQESPTISKAWQSLGLRLTPLPRNQRNLVGPRYRGGLRVTQVRPQSPAAANGIRQGDILVGLHVWETVNEDNLTYVVNHPQLNTFDPLKFYILRGKETLYGHLNLAY